MFDLLSAEGACLVKRMNNEKGPMCTDKCEHAEYIEEGDFICAITQDVTIVGFCPMECQCPDKRKEQGMF